MIDGAKARQIAFEYVSTIDNIKILNNREKETLGFKTKFEIWEVETEISHDNSIFPISFHVVLTTEFPLELPKIFLSPKTFEKVKYIPHVDSNRFVCTFDSEISSTNPDEPAGIITECIRKAKNIIIDGLSGSNRSDFQDEFKAYWEEKYGKEKFLPQNILSLISEIKPNTCLKLICLKRDIRTYKYVLHSSDEISERFKFFLDEYNFEYEDIDVYYLGVFPLDTPPFDLKNRDVIKIVKSAGNEAFENFEKFINNSNYPKLVVCEKHFGEKSYLFGWFHKHINSNIKGFRPNALKQFRVISTVQSNENVSRISTDVFTKERLAIRTSGLKVKENEKTFLIAGVGSLGSNLIYFLNSINSPAFKLIDSDKIRIENIQRHLLGFEHIGNYKTKAIQDYILRQNPLQKVSTKESSIIDVINCDTNFLNESDYIFITIGNANIDNWICQSLKEGIINKPIFIIWVEPFLCGGHCVYLHPSNPDFEKYFEEGLFKYNVIDRLEYQSGNKKLSLREAGCQTTYIPYSGTNVISFISCLFPFISSIIDYTKEDSKAYSWLGNFDEVKKSGLNTSSYYDDKIVGSVIEHKL